MKQNILILTFFLLLKLSIINAQDTCYIKIIDKNNKPVVGVLLQDKYNNKVFGVSNDNGEMKIILQNSNLFYTSHIGYFSSEINLSSKQKKIDVTISESFKELANVEVRDWKNLLLQSIKKTAKNTSQKKTLYTGSYISTGRTSEKPIFFHSANTIAQIDQYGEKNNLKLVFDSSFVYQTKNGQGIDTFKMYIKPFYILNLAYSCHLPINEKNIKDFSIDLTNVITTPNSHKIFEISFSNNSDIDEGKIYIEDSTYAIRKISYMQKFENMQIQKNNKIAFLTNHFEVFTYTFEKNKNNLYELKTADCNISAKLKIGNSSSETVGRLKYISNGVCPMCKKITNEEIEKVLSTSNTISSSPFEIEKDDFKF